jgi:hypothetical protein
MNLIYTPSCNVQCTERTNKFVKFVVFWVITRRRVVITDFINIAAAAWNQINLCWRDVHVPIRIGNTDRPLRLKAVVFFANVNTGVPSLIRIWELIQKFKETSVEDSSSYKWTLLHKLEQKWALLSCGAFYIYTSWCSGRKACLYICRTDTNIGFANPVNTHTVFGKVEVHRSNHERVSVNGIHSISERQLRARWPAR